MEETTTAEAPVETSLDDKIAAKLFGSEPEEAPAATPPTDPEELSSEELPSDDPASDEWELNHNGNKRRVPRDEAIKLAQQGFDYTQKTQQLAEERKLVEQQRAAVEARARITPQLIKAGAAIEALQQQIQPYANADWVQLAQQDPSNYAAHHATYQRLQDSLRQAIAQFQQVESQSQALDQVVSDADIESAKKRMFEKVPAWQDRQRFEKDRERLFGHFQEVGFSDKDLKGFLLNPEFIVMARESMLYREAMKNRQVAKNQIPQAPAVRPGAAPARVTPQQEKQEVVKQLRQAKDPAKRKELFEEALARKFNLR